MAGQPLLAPVGQRLSLAPSPPNRAVLRPDSMMEVRAGEVRATRGWRQRESRRGSTNNGTASGLSGLRTGVLTPLAVPM